MKDYEERQYKGYTICIEYHGDTPFKDRRIFVKDPEGKEVKYFVTANGTTLLTKLNGLSLKSYMKTTIAGTRIENLNTAM